MHSQVLMAGMFLIDLNIIRNLLLFIHLPLWQVCWPLHHSSYKTEVGAFSGTFDSYDAFSVLTITDFLSSPSSTTPMQVKEIYLKSSRRCKTPIFKDVFSFSLAVWSRKERIWGVSHQPGTCVCCHASEEYGTIFHVLNLDC